MSEFTGILPKTRFDSQKEFWDHEFAPGKTIRNEINELRTEIYRAASIANKEEKMEATNQVTEALKDAIADALIDGDKVRVNYAKKSGRWGDAVTETEVLLNQRGVFDSFYKLNFGFTDPKTATFANGGAIYFVTYDDVVEGVTFDYEYDAEPREPKVVADLFPTPWKKCYHAVYAQWEVVAANGTLVSRSFNAAAADAVVEAGNAPKLLPIRWGKF